MYWVKNLRLRITRGTFKVSWTTYGTVQTGWLRRPSLISHLRKKWTRYWEPQWQCHVRSTHPITSPCAVISASLTDPCQCNNNSNNTPLDRTKKVKPKSINILSIAFFTTTKRNSRWFILEKRWLYYASRCCGLRTDVVFLCVEIWRPLVAGADYHMTIEVWGL